ncbi:hypothetical protein Pla123a_17390 [Posidoniimonas polymericola]|uniref:Nucleoside phosphorylase domain-containing protein n=1 Tax=Posidoniimonas polymericola TaxID=2528002 RepID=A0A5C5YT33_9BACT|nr:hypothetical protein [Posidoniimonas polymericola]TWT77940.1 hypothetical protein Pla123a_17390 [Posidoniimonas polymericola]
MAQPAEPLGPDRVTVAIVAESAAIADRVADRLTTRRRVDSGSLSVVVGDLRGVVVAVATPKSPASDWGQVVRSLRAAHRPAVLIAAGLVTPNEEGQPAAGPVRFAAAVDRDRICYRLPTDTADQVWVVAHPQTQTNQADARADWPAAIAAVCAEFDLPLAMFAAVDTAGSAGAEWRSLTRQPSAAGKLGAALAGVWRRPAFAKEAATRFAQRWKQLDQLVDRIEQFAGAAQGRVPGAPRRD